MEYIKDERIKRYQGGDFIRRFYWNVSAFTDNSDIKSGYIVQHIARKTIDSKGQFSDFGNNHDYWEAWKIEDNRVMLDENGCHDCWTSSLTLFNQASVDYDINKNVNDRRNSSGYTIMEGHVYWAPLGSELAEVVRETFQKGQVRYAVELLSAWTINAYQRFTPVFCHAFSHSWNIDDPEDISHLITPIDDKRVNED